MRFDRSPSVCRIALTIAFFAIQIATGQELDSFGGWKDFKGTATGAFHLESINGRTMLVTPEGHGFVALGVNHIGAVRSQGEEEPNLFEEKYDSDSSRLSEMVAQQYSDWGFNTVDDSVKELTQRYPYFAAQTFARTAKYFAKPGEGNAYDFPDVFDPSVQERLEKEVESYTAKHKNNPNLIAYYWTDTPTWDLQKTRRFRGTDWVSEIRALSPKAPGRVRYAEFLSDRYRKDVEAFNRAYLMDVESFEDLETVELGGIDLSRYEIERDDQDFLGVIARGYYGILGPAMRKSDPNHMIFGEKYLLGDLPSQVALAAVPYVDAIAVQPGDGYIPIYTPGDTFPKEEIEALRRLTGKPIIICDHQISFATPRYPKATWPYYQRESEKEAARATEQFIREAFRYDYLLGYMRCQYIDRFSTRRDGVKLGLVRDDGSPYAELVKATKKANRLAKDLVRK